MIAQLGASSGTGSDDLFVIEADESDGTFLLYDTSIALITNVDPDHLDHYGTDDAFYEAFATFANRAREAVVISADDAGARAVAERLTHPNVVTFGESDAADVRVTGIRTDGPVSFTISHDGVVGRRAAGGSRRAQRDQRGRRRRRAAHARATSSSPPCARSRGSRAPCAASSCTASSAASASSTTTRTTRPRSRPPSCAARTVVGDGRIIAIQQPHTYSRTQQMYREFAEVLERYADHTVDARRLRRARGSGARRDRRARLAARSPTPRTCTTSPTGRQAADYTATVAREGDYVITLGCGNVYQIIPQVLDALSRTPDAASAAADAAAE